MTQEPLFTQAEQDAVVAAMQHFGPCNCAVAPPVSASAPLQRTCSGHSFLSERDGPQDLPRLHRLLFVRRTAERFKADEWRGRCAGCQRDDAQFETGHTDLCARCALNVVPAEPAAPDVLSW